MARLDSLYFFNDLSRQRAPSMAISLCMGGSDVFIDQQLQLGPRPHAALRKSA